MATIGTEHSSEKQKGDTFSSNSRSNTSSTGQRVRRRDKKQVPNYLKPTVSSSNEAVKNVNKNESVSDQEKSQSPNLYRIGCKETVSSEGQEKPAKSYRSTLFSSKPITVNKTCFGRVARNPNAGKSQSQSSTFSNMKKTITTTTLNLITPANKKGGASSSSKKSGKKTKHGNKEEVVVKDDSESELLPKAEESECQEQNVGEIEEIKESKVHKETSTDDDEEEINVEHGHEDNKPKETKTETEENGEDNTNINAVDNQEVDGAVEEETKEVAAKKTIQAQRRHRNKECPTESSYNDMIEETASKLREERKNKVKALVGAFETVIDKETSKF